MDSAVVVLSEYSVYELTGVCFALVVVTVVLSAVGAWLGEKAADEVSRRDER